MSGDPEQEYFSDGISEDIITDLSKIAGLMVIARNSSFTYKGRSVDIRAVGRELGVQFGARRLGPPRRQSRAHYRAAHRCRQRRPSVGRALRSRPHRYLRGPGRCDPSDRRGVEGTLSPAEKARLAESGTINIVAYDCVLRGRELLMAERGPRDVRAIGEFNREAMELDPNYSLAYDGPRLCIMYRLPKPLERKFRRFVLQAKHDVKKAIEKDPRAAGARHRVDGRDIRKGFRSSESGSRYRVGLQPQFLRGLACLGKRLHLRADRSRRSRGSKRR